MKILYQLILEDNESFKASDFPDRFEILREGKTPLVWKPVAISMQDIYNKLNEAEQLLKEIKENINFIPIHIAIDKYFKRYSQ